MASVENEKDKDKEIDLLEILFVLKSKILIILASMIFVGVLAGLYSFIWAKPVYESSSRLYILTKSTSITSLADIQVGTSLTQDYKELITSRTVVEEVIKNLELECTYAQMLTQIEVTNPTNTRILVLTVKDNDPQKAKVLVDELTAVAQEKISVIMDQKAPSVVEYGNVPVKPVSPNKKKNIAIGMAIGIFISSAIIIVIHLLDDSVKTSEDVEKYLGLNTLTSVPLREGEKKKKKLVKRSSGQSNRKGGKK